MRYRRLGSAGIQLSELSYGSWVTFGKQIDLAAVRECMSAAYDAGVNFFDNAEAYAHGQSEILMGEALKKLGWRRGSYLVSTKLYWGLHEGPNEKNTLNRKYLLEGLSGSLKRLQLDYVDLLYCHRPDPNTEIQEIVWAMHDIISRGQALYWGTSEWSAAQIEEAFQVAEGERLRRPVVEQPEYNLFSRKRFEVEYAPLFEKRRLGSTTWSPLASGLLSGKYLDGVPKGSRLSLSGLEWLRDKLLQPQMLNAVKQLKTIADQLECTLPQLAIAWCLKNPNISSVITGATSLQQLKENLGAGATAAKLDGAICARMEEICKSASA